MIGCRPLSDAELAAVSSAFSGEMEHRDRLLFWLGVTTGFRVSELLSLRVDDLWRGRQCAETVRIRRRHTKGKRRGQSAHVAPFVRPLARRWLFVLWDRYGHEGAMPLFISRSGARKPISRMQAYRVLRKVFTLAEVDGGPGELGTHTMRKTYAAKMYAHFGDLFAVQRALRHASPASTVAYLSFNDSELAHAIELQWPDSRKDPTRETPMDQRILTLAPRR